MGGVALGERKSLEQLEAKEDVIMPKDRDWPFPMEGMLLQQGEGGVWMQAQGVVMGRRAENPRASSPFPPFPSKNEDEDSEEWFIFEERERGTKQPSRKAGE